MMRPGNAQEIWLIRHGTAASAPSLAEVAGRLVADPPLSELGRAQCEALAQRFDALALDDMKVLSSPLRRCIETARTAFPQASIDIDERLAEYDAGELEGASGAMLKLRDKIWDEGRWDSWPGGETRSAFRARVESALELIVSSNPCVTAVVAHAGVINEVLSTILSSTPRYAFHVHTSSVSRLGLGSGSPFVVSVNDTWHLEDSLASRLEDAP